LNPSEKYESQLGLLFPIYGKIKAMFQATNQKFIALGLWSHHFEIAQRDFADVALTKARLVSVSSTIKKKNIIPLLCRILLYTNIAILFNIA